VLRGTGDEGLDVGAADRRQRTVSDARVDVQAERPLVQQGSARAVRLRLEPGSREVGEQHPAGGWIHVGAAQEITADLVQPAFGVGLAGEVPRVLLVGGVAVAGTPATVRPPLHRCHRGHLPHSVGLERRAGKGPSPTSPIERRPHFDVVDVPGGRGG
jgi:hypothetical protein